MICLRKKLRLLLLLSFVYQPIIFADIEDQYRNQKVEGECSYENAQFYRIYKNDFGKSLVDKFCVSGEFWTEYHHNGDQKGSGVLNKSVKEIKLQYTSIKKFKIEGNDFVRYSCEGTSYPSDFDCIGPVRRQVRASRGSQMDIKFNQTSNKSIAYYNRGVTKDNIGDYSGAIDDYTNAIKLDPNDVGVYNNRGISKSKIGDNSGALDDYTYAIKLNPNYKSAYTNRGVSKAKTGDYSGAIDDFTYAIKLDPNDADAYTKRSAARYRFRDYEGFCEDLKIAYRLGKKALEKLFAFTCKN